MSEQEVLSYIFDRLSLQFDIERIVLFGSRATGTADVDSDWDVLVVANSEQPFLLRQQQALLALKGRSFPLDLLVYTPFEMRTGNYLGSTVNFAETEGKVFYTKH